MTDKTLENIKIDSGSFRDRTAQVFHFKGEIYRGLNPDAAETFELFSKTDAYSKLISTNKIIDSVIDNSLPDSVLDDDWTVILKHQKIPFISYPYEWPFQMLREAALLQLDVILELLKDGYILKDGSAYNIQWQGKTPVFIDIGSIARFNGEGLWSGYRQFCQHFLYPLMLQSYKSIDGSALLRSELEGIEPAQCRKMLGIKGVFRKGVLFHVILQDISKKNIKLRNNKVNKLSLPDHDLLKMIANNIRGLIDIIKTLKLHDSSHWETYGETHSYDESDSEIKEKFIHFAGSFEKWNTVWDIGCNNGKYSKIIAQYSDYVVAVDADHATVNNLFNNLTVKNSGNILPLRMNLANPSPSQGWNGCERHAFTERGKPQLIIALALIHHIVISNYIPLSHFLDWLKSNCSYLVIEFVDIDDPMVSILMQATDEPVDDYSKENFELELRKRFCVLKETVLGNDQRTLYFCETMR